MLGKTDLILSDNIPHRRKSLVVTHPVQVIIDQKTNDNIISVHRSKRCGSLSHRSRVRVQILYRQPLVTHIYLNITTSYVYIIQLYYYSHTCNNMHENVRVCVVNIHVTTVIWFVAIVTASDMCWCITIIVISKGKLGEQFPKYIIIRILIENTYPLYSFIYVGV